MVVGTRPSLHTCVNSEASMADSGSVLWTLNCGPDHILVSAGSKPHLSADASSCTSTPMCTSRCVTWVGECSAVARTAC